MHPTNRPPDRSGSLRGRCVHGVALRFGCPQVLNRPGRDFACVCVTAGALLSPPDGQRTHGYVRGYVGDASLTHCGQGPSDPLDRQASDGVDGVDGLQGVEGPEGPAGGARRTRAPRPRPGSPPTRGSRRSRRRSALHGPDHRPSGRYQVSGRQAGLGRSPRRRPPRRRRCLGSPARKCFLDEDAGPSLVRTKIPSPSPSEVTVPGPRPRPARPQDERR
jgi:hypothetical protein